MIAEPTATEVSKPERISWWFPINACMVEHSEFAKLSPTAGVALLDINFRLHSHLNSVKRKIHRKPFSHFDSVWAKRLCRSTGAFRAACKRLHLLGWITRTPGRNLPTLKATTYQSALFARPIPRYAKFSRRLWEKLIEHLQRGDLRHVDLITFAVLAYFWEIGGRQRLGAVTVPKRCLVATGLTVKRVHASVSRISSALPGVVSLTMHRTSIEFIADFDENKPVDCP